MLEPNNATIGKAASAAKWSIAAQLFAKLVSPITTLILARILTPEAFGVVATVTMVVSFAEMFSDAGFQKYLIQHDFRSDGDLYESANIAFWSNFCISITLWVLIGLFRDEIAVIVGNPGLGIVVLAACANLPIVSFCSVQTAIFQRKFNFKILFIARMATSVITLLTAVPLAILGFDYWSMIISTVISNLTLSVVLLIKSDWRPSFFFEFSLFKNMLSFSIWTLFEAFTIWLVSWIGTIVLGALFDAYYLGLYKTAVSLVASITSLATSALNPVIFATLSRFQGDRGRFDSIFYKMQTYLAVVVVPISLVLLVFREQVVFVLLGEQWIECALFFGMYAAASSLVVVFGHTASEAYRSLGKPRLSALSQVVYLLLITPFMIYSAKKGFEFFSWSLPVARVVFSITIDFAICKVALNLSPAKMVKSQAVFYSAGAFMVIVSYCCLLITDNVYLQFAMIFIAFASYLVVVLLNKSSRVVVFEILRRFGAVRRGGLLEKVAER